MLLKKTMNWQVSMPTTSFWPESSTKAQTQRQGPPPWGGLFLMHLSSEQVPFRLELKENRSARVRHDILGA